MERERKSRQLLRWLWCRRVRDNERRRKRVEERILGKLKLGFKLGFKEKEEQRVMAKDGERKLS